MRYERNSKLYVMGEEQELARGQAGERVSERKKE